MWAGPRVFVEESDPNTKGSADPTKDNHESGWTVVEEESMHLMVKGGLAHARPDMQIMALRLIVITALALAALVIEGIIGCIIERHAPAMRA